MCVLCFICFVNTTPPTEIYTLSLHDALPISFAGIGGSARSRHDSSYPASAAPVRAIGPSSGAKSAQRSEEHTSELQSLTNLVCRLLLEKKKQTTRNTG